MTNSTVVEYLYHILSKLLRENYIKYVRWNLNTMAIFEVGESFSRVALMAGGILLPKTIGDDTAFEIRLELLR